MKTNSKIECILLILTVLVLGNFSSFAQHELFVRVEGGNPTDFERSIKSVTISMKKTHQNGNITYDKVSIDRKKIIRSFNIFKLSFLRKGEENNTKWLDYQYKTSWNFFGGHKLETEWVKSSRKNIIVLTSPFAQRELAVILDPQTSDELGRSIKSVTFLMKKTHQNGDITNGEVRINRKKNIREGDYFKLTYLRKDEEDNTKWLDYQYKTSWIFFGGHNLETEWAKSNWMSIHLISPLRQKTIEFEADSDTVTESEIRAIHVKVYYLLGDKEQTKRMTLKKDELYKTLDITLPKNVDEFEYEVNWKLKGNKRKSSGRIKTNRSYLFIDELPKE